MRKTEINLNQRNHEIRVLRKNAFQAYAALAEKINDKKVSDMDKSHKYELYAYAARFVGYANAEKIMAIKAVKILYTNADSLAREAPATLSSKFTREFCTDLAGVVAQNAFEIAGEFKVHVSTYGYKLGTRGLGKQADVFAHYSNNDEYYAYMANRVFVYPLERVILPEQYDLATQSKVA